MFHHLKYQIQQSATGIWDICRMSRAINEEFLLQKKQCTTPSDAAVFQMI
jgi:hypothetical protein